MSVKQQTKPKPSPSFQAWRSFRTAHAALALRVGEELSERDLVPLDWLEVLLAVGEGPGRRLRMYELARIVFLSRSGLTRLADRMTNAGLLAREQCPSDKRGSFAVLTSKGEAALRKAMPVYTAAVAEHFGGEMTATALRTLRETLDRIAAQADVDDRILCAGAPGDTRGCPDGD